LSIPKVLCAGIAVQDIIMKVENFPAPGSKVSASEFLIIGGGCAANQAVAIARLGGNAAFAGPLGGASDAISSRILTDLEADSIDCSGAVRVEGGMASVSVIMVDAAGEKLVGTRRGTNLGDALPADAEKLVADIAVLSFDNRFPPFVMALGRAAAKRNIPIVVDLDQVTAPDDSLLALGTHVIASAEGLKGTTGLSDHGAGLRKLAKYNRGFLASTDGANGIYWLEDGTVKHMPAFKVNVIDSLGAGDAFHGAFAMALAEGKDAIAAIRFAGAVAGLKCTKFGGTTGSPKRDEVETFLQKNA
jgi:sugar/nucleoside kinase (ribokinase family)